MVRKSVNNRVIMNSISDNLSLEFSILKKYGDNIIPNYLKKGDVPFHRSIQAKKHRGDEVILILLLFLWQMAVFYWIKRNVKKVFFSFAWQKIPSNLGCNKKKNSINAISKNELEDLYSPFKKARKTKAGWSKEQGLQPLSGADMGGQRLIACLLLRHGVGRIRS